MTTCVHCGKEIINHKCHDPGGNYFACPCFNVKSGRFIGWHPTNRFTPRQLTPVQDAETAATIRGADGSASANLATGSLSSPATVTNRFTPRSEEQSMKQAWKSDNGKYYDSELEAAKADAEYWKAQHQQSLARDHTDSGYSRDPVG